MHFLLPLRIHTNPFVCQRFISVFRFWVVRASAVTKAVSGTCGEPCSA